MISQDIFMFSATAISKRQNPLSEKHHGIPALGEVINARFDKEFGTLNWLLSDPVYRPFSKRVYLFVITPVVNDKEYARVLIKETLLLGIGGIFDLDGHKSIHMLRVGDFAQATAVVEGAIRVLENEVE